MKRLDSIVLLFGALILVTGSAKAQCLGAIPGTPAGQTPEVQTFTASTTINTSTITVASTAGMTVGMILSGPGIPAGATVTSIINGTQFSIAPALATATQASVAGFSFNNWGAFTAPAATTVTRIGVVTNGSNVIQLGGCLASWMVGTPISGPFIPPGTTITGGTCPNMTMSNAATGSNGPSGATYTFTLPPYTSNFPPPTVGITNFQSCSICPATFETTICAGQYFYYYMCAGNNYTFSMCGAGAWNSTITVTTPAGTAAAPGFPTFDNDGCGTPGGQAVLNFIPSANGQYAVRVFQNACSVNNGLCGTIQIQCAINPAPPPNDEPTGAVVLPLSSTCNFVPATNAFSTGSSGTVTPTTPVSCGPTCGVANSGNYSGSDVWFQTTIGPLGTLGIQTELISAGNIAMAVYTGTPGVLLTQLGGSPNYCGSCNDDSSPGILNPFLSLSGLAPGLVVYIRVWSNSGIQNTGSFRICVYEPVPPPNDNPCGAIVLPVNVNCSLQSFTTESALPLDVNLTTSPATPSCGTPVAGGDVWFSVVMPGPGPTGSVTLNTQAGSLTDMAMAVYTLTSGTLCAPVSGTLTEVACNDNFGASNMPSLTISGPTGNTYYVRLWNKTTAFGTASICAIRNDPPTNDDPCGAFALPVSTGCNFPAPYTTQFATVTGGTAVGVVSIPNPSCAAGPYNSDVWFTAVIPASGQLVIDSDNGQLNDAAIAVYTATGSCGGSNLSLTQVPVGQGGCVIAGSTNGALMPRTTVTGLAPGTTVYIRVWRQTNNDGTFQICASNPAPPAGCFYTLNMSDVAGDGWNGGFLTLCVAGVCTDYTVYGALSTVIFGANLGDVITLNYTPVGGFQNQVAFNVVASNGFLLHSSPATPVAGFQFGVTVNSTCNVPPAPVSDCLGAVTVCNNQLINYNPSNTGNVADLNSSNDGCLAGEQQGVWFRFTTNAAGTLAFTLNVPGGTDYDFAVWGPYSTLIPPCPPSSQPIRCNWSATTGPTGLNYTSLQPSVGAIGSPFSQFINVLANQTYLLYVDNWSRNGIAFSLQWNNNPTNILDCTLPIELLDFTAIPGQRSVDLKWITASEQGASHFVVERSDDGVAFQSIGLVAAVGNTGAASQYHHVDPAPMIGLNHYRLAMVDLDGSIALSRTIPVRFGWLQVPVQVFPNPAGSSLWVAFESTELETMRWRISDASGRLVQDGRTGLNPGNNQFEVQLGMDAGFYQLELLDERGSIIGQARFVKD
ncbi:MAG: T9SS type A sorting domain-containing protein [Flavobacteriales bacterium]|nr:T9SS type A sorting domain-containing protein [Flavobacteriales bacterium]